MKEVKKEPTEKKHQHIKILSLQGYNHRSISISSGFFERTGGATAPTEFYETKQKEYNKGKEAEMKEFTEVLQGD